MPRINLTLGDPRPALKVALLTHRRWLVTAALILTCVLLLSGLGSPFSLLFSAVHSHRALLDTATSLNHQRTESAREYFRAYPKSSPTELREMAQRAYNRSAANSETEEIKSSSTASKTFPFSSAPGSSASDSSSFSFNPTPLFTIVIITTGRKRPKGGDSSVGYVLQSARALHALVRARSPTHLLSQAFLFLCNVDSSPDVHHEDASLLRDYLPYVERYGGSSMPAELDQLVMPGTEKLYRQVRRSISLDQEREDYSFCLQAAHAFPAKYYLVFQDDALPLPEFPAVLQLTLDKLDKGNRCAAQTQRTAAASSDSGPRSSAMLECLSQLPPYTSHLLPAPRRPLTPFPNCSFGYLKFYFPERWQGFALETKRLLDLLSVGCVGGGLALILQGAVHVHARRSAVLYRPSWRCFLLGILLTLLLAEVVGRQSLWELRRVSRFLYQLQPAPACCVPAMLYPRPVLPFLLTWLADSAPGSKVDLRVSELCDLHALPQYALEPNVVRHAGMVTSLFNAQKQKPVEEFLWTDT